MHVWSQNTKIVEAWTDPKIPNEHRETGRKQPWTGSQARDRHGNSTSWTRPGNGILGPSFRTRNARTWITHTYLQRRRRFGGCGHWRKRITGEQDQSECLFSHRIISDSAIQNRENDVIHTTKRVCNDTDCIRKEFFCIKFSFAFMCVTKIVKPARFEEFSTVLSGLMVNWLAVGGCWL